MNNPKKLPVYSYSKVNSFYNCPYYFFMNYFDKPKDFEPVGHGTSEFGSYVHKILEMYEKNELKLQELLPYYEKHYDENVTSSFAMNFGGNFSKDMWKMYYDDGKKYFEEFKGFKDIEILESEYEFYDEVNNSFILNGKIDLVAKDKYGELMVIDHKSKGKFKNKKEKEQYSRQLYLYAFAIKNKYGKFPKKLAFNMFRNNIWVEFDFDKKKYDESMNWLIKSVQEIEDCIDFYAVPNTFYCNNFCTFRDICDKKG